MLQINARITFYFSDNNPDAFAGPYPAIVSIKNGVTTPLSLADFGVTFNQYSNENANQEFQKTLDGNGNLVQLTYLFF